MKLIEPQRWIAIVKTLHKIMIQSPVLLDRVPILSDVFVFTYPIYLGGLYTYGRMSKNKEYKKAALFMFTGVVSTTAINICIQYFVNKVRPNIVLGFDHAKTETILHHLLPSSSFPSDHAAVSMSIAVATIIRWIKKQDKKYLRFGSILIIFSLIMGICRITTAVHWPTDIIAGIVVGITIPLLLSSKKIFSWLENIFTWIANKI